MGLRERFSSGIWANRDYRRYWLASTVSSFGSEVTHLALPVIALLTLHASPLQMGIIAFAQEGPLLVLGLVAGVSADRRLRLPLMKRMDLARAAVLLVVPVAWWLGVLTVPLLIAVAFAVGCLSVFFDVSAQAMTSTLLDPADYVEGNGKRYAGESAARVAGPGLGGALMSAIGGAPTILVDCASYLWSWWMLRGMTFVEPEPEASAHEPILTSVREGLREVWINPYLRATTTSTATINLVGDIGYAMMVPFMVRVLGFGPGLVGAVLAISGLGSLVGALLSSRVIARTGVGRGLQVALVASMPPMALVMLAGGPRWLAAAMVMAGLFVANAISPTYDITQFSLRQAVTPNRLRGRVTAATRVAIRGSAAIGMLLGGVVATGIGLRGALLFGVLAPVIPLLVITRSPVAALETIPASPDGIPHAA